MTSILSSYDRLTRLYEEKGFPPSYVYDRLYEQLPDTIVVFRGDAGLRRGYPPLAPTARRILWRGGEFDFSIEEALLDALYRLYELESGEQLKHIQDACDISGFLVDYVSPFVSTTGDLRIAIRYAAGWPWSKRNVDWSQVINLAKERCHDNFRYLSVIEVRKERLPVPVFWLVPDKWSLAKHEYEILVPGLIHPEEIIGYISLNDILQLLERESIDFAETTPIRLPYQDLIDVVDAIPHTRPRSQLTLPCCGQRLTYAHEPALAGQGEIVLCRVQWIGEDPGPMAEFLNRNLAMETAADFGLGVFCPDCELLSIRRSVLDRSLLVRVEAKPAIRRDEKTITISVRITNETNKTLTGLAAWLPYSDRKGHSWIDIGSIHDVRVATEVSSGLYKLLTGSEIYTVDELSASEIEPGKSRDLTLEFRDSESDGSHLQELRPASLFFSDGSVETSLIELAAWKDWDISIETGKRGSRDGAR